MINKTRLPGLVRLPLVGAGVLWLSTLAAQSVSPAPAQSSGADTVQRPNAVLFSAGPGVSARGGGISRIDIDSIKQQLAPYQDPQQRKTLQLEQRARIVEDHPDLAEMLGLNAATERRLIDLLTDQAMSTRQRALESFLAGLSGTNRAFDSTRMETVDAYTRDRGAIREILGTPTFGRYLDYIRTSQERGAVARFNRRLGPDALSREQREPMIELLAKQARERRFGFDDSSGIDGMREYLDLMNKGAGDSEVSRYNLLRNVKGNEASFARALESGTELLQASAQILTVSQQLVFAAMEAERIESHRSYVRMLRKDAGLDPDAPIAAPARPAAAPGPSRVRWSVSIAINGGEPKLVTFVGDVGQAVSFEIGEQLSIEAVPTARAAQLHIDMKVYETLGTGRHVIGDLYGRTQLQPAPDPNWTRAQQQTVLMGSKGYEVAFSVIGSAN